MNLFAKDFNMAQLRAQSSQEPLYYSLANFYSLRTAGALVKGTKTQTINSVTTMFFTRAIFGIVPQHLKRTDRQRMTFEIAVRLLVSGALHPLSIAAIWQQLSTYQQPLSLVQTFYMIRNTKSIWDGLPEHLFAEGCYLITTQLLKKFLVYLRVPLPQIIERRNQPQVYIRSAVNKLFAILGYSAFCDYLARIIIYPLNTIRYRIEAQGVGPSFPIIYSNGLEVAQSIYNKFGIAGFYSGINILFLSTVPETVTLIVVYQIVMMALRFLPEDPNDEVNVYLETNLRRFLDLIK
eukprot:TRINITY_DN9837_c0_g1_i1.p1 TRINITY_DN9837_c0_g1~~TRINITY_DN9837_c0_g1_i1.p1  ORF type:complete len:304 (-),score=34.75 TRINITY_DN9837_c0_g1_i1:11-889(-)